MNWVEMMYFQLLWNSEAVSSKPPISQSVLHILHTRIFTV